MNSPEKALAEQASKIAHDMRTPLSVLKSFVNLPGDLSDEELEEYRAAAQRSVEKLLDLADQLTNFAKAEKDKS